MKVAAKIGYRKSNDHLKEAVVLPAGEGKFPEHRASVSCSEMRDPVLKRSLTIKKMAELLRWLF